MTYEEKGIWVFLLVNAVTFVTYVVVILTRAGDGELAQVPYVSTLLWTIGVSIAAAVVGRILVEIAKPSDSHRADVRDKEINRYGEYVAGSILAVGMVIPFALALAGAAHFWIANAMYAVYTLAFLIGPALKLVAYRRGM
ncbi:hypothetical protein [Nonomuraea typhae]|uniref:hypothetical protein n=1 Tax=Nonomuraea typhae TaxID=2603600 RepID=UPI0012F98DE7|nr:hypothetical protein [Nonomuraea typhae]